MKGPDKQSGASVAPRFIAATFLCQSGLGEASKVESAKRGFHYAPVQIALNRAGGDQRVCRRLFGSGEFSSPNGGVRPPLHQTDSLPNEWGVPSFLTATSL